VQGGVERFIESLILSNNSASNTYSVVCTGNKDETYIYNGVKVISFSKSFEIASTPISWNFFFGLKRIVREYDLIHYHYPYPFADITHIFNRIKKPYVITFHSDIVSQKRLRVFYAPFEKIFLTNALKIYATSLNYLNSSNTLKEFRHKTSSIPIGISKPVFKRKESNPRLPEKFFCFIGVLRYYKGVEILLKASIINRLPLVIIGDGPYRDLILRYIKSYNLRNIHYLGALNNDAKFNVLEQSYALVFPSTHRSEAFGITLLEAFSLRKSVISFDLGTGTSFVNRHLRTGLLLEEISEVGLASAMNLLWNDERLAKRLGKNANKDFTTKFNPNLFGKRYLNEYRNILIPDQKLITVSLVLYENSLESLTRLLSTLSLLKNSSIYLIDNSPLPIDTYKLLRRYPNVNYFFMNKNLGYGKGHNFALRLIEKKSKYHLIINPDITLKVEDIDRLIVRMDSIPSASVCMPQIKYRNGKNQYLAKLLPNFYLLILRRFFSNLNVNFFQSILFKYELKNFSLPKVSNVPSLSGCFLLARTKDLVAVNGFDPRFFMYMEDVDLVRRLKFNGKKQTLYFSDIFVIHGYSKKSYKSLKFLFYHSISAIKYFFKWGWFFDKERNRINNAFILSCKKFI
jgi:GT2 family glycosyltransferase/glycosyltransferase involved in cell wall biosynthesis